MAKVVIFRTPGRLPLEAVTVMGLTAKPSTDTPIGRFGTGLKYTIATLLRKHIKVELYIGTVRYTLYTTKDNFRGTEVDYIHLKKQDLLAGLRPSYKKLPFTTQLGRDWEIWQCFRELYSNTLDEKGETFAVSEQQVAALVSGEHTMIVVYGEDMLKQLEKKEEVFLPSSAPKRLETSGIEVVDRKSDKVFYRGVRALELKKPSMFTYNIKSNVSLTEDRTIKYNFELHYLVCAAVVTSTDKAFIEKAIAPDKGSWEEEIEYSYVSEKPSKEFMEVVRGARGAVSSSALRYYSSYAAPSEKTYDTFTEFPTPWSVRGTYITDANNKYILVLSSDAAGGKAEKMLEDLVSIINGVRPNTSGKPIKQSIGVLTTPVDDQEIPF